MDIQKKQKISDGKTALSKAEHYCAYQERSQQEVRDKLFEWELRPQVVEDIISQLITGGFLNEERFAKAYANGKFNQKAWGRLKIKQGLKLKKVPDVLIKKVLESLNRDAYLQTLEKVIQKKNALISEKDPYKRRYKLLQYARGRGFETDLVTDVLKDNGL
jgi:regulatory protein